MTWWEYVQRTSERAEQKEIAEKTGVSAPTISRWSRGMQPSAENVAAFARAYRVPVLEALVAAGVLTPDEAKARVFVSHRADLTDDELLDEIAARLRRGRQEDPHAQAAPMTQRDVGAIAHFAPDGGEVPDPEVRRAHEERLRRVRRGEEPQR